MRVISAIFIFLWCYLIGLSNDRSYKFNLILTVNEVKPGYIFYWLKKKQTKNRRRVKLVYD